MKRIDADALLVALREREGAALIEAGRAHRANDLHAEGDALARLAEIRTLLALVATAPEAAC